MCWPLSLARQEAGYQAAFIKPLATRRYRPGWTFRMAAIDQSSRSPRTA